MSRIRYGQTWWGGEWLNALAHIDYSNRLPGGRNYTSKGAVKELASLTVSTGEKWITELSTRELKQLFAMN